MRIDWSGGDIWLLIGGFLIIHFILLLFWRFWPWLRFWFRNLLFDQLFLLLILFKALCFISSFSFGNPLKLVDRSRSGITFPDLLHLWFRYETLIVDDPLRSFNTLRPLPIDSTLELFQIFIHSLLFHLRLKFTHPFLLLTPYLLL